MNEEPLSPGQSSVPKSIFMSKSPTNSQSSTPLRRQESSPPILQTATFESHSTADGSSCHSVEDVYESQHEDKEIVELPHVDTADSTHAPPQHLEKDFEDALAVVLLSAFSYFGFILRIYMARLFGMDCDLKETPDAVDDFLSPLSNLICITATGRTEQTGGALFVDLPANMLGCFLIGLLTPAVNGHSIPWFRADHPLQSHTAFHTALKVGFCGSLTTFASWNTQMVTMMDGTFSELGPQVPAALFGYIVGIACCLTSFSVGRNAYDWWRARHPIPEPDSAVDEELGETTVTMSSRCDKLSCAFGIHAGPLILSALLAAAFVFGDAVQGISFYRHMWMALFLAPLGALLRWKLSAFNTDRLPRGTLAANLMAAALYVLIEALNARYIRDSSDPWIRELAAAAEVALCGSLSTVSTLVKEIAEAPTPARGHLYGLATIVSAMFLGLAIYSPIARW